MIGAVQALRPWLVFTPNPPLHLLVMNLSIAFSSFIACICYIVLASSVTITANLSFVDVKVGISDRIDFNSRLVLLYKVQINP